MKHVNLISGIYYNIYRISIQYVPEKDVVGFARKQGLPIVKNKCKADGNTKREEIKNFMKNMGKDFDYFEETVFSAIKRSELEGWGEINEFLRTGK